MTRSSRDEHDRYVAIIPFKYTHYNLQPLSNKKPMKDDLQIEVREEGLYFKSDVMNKEKLIPREQLPPGFPKKIKKLEDINTYMPEISKLINPQNIQENFYLLIPSENPINGYNPKYLEDLKKNAKFWSNQLAERVNAKPDIRSIKIEELYVPEKIYEKVTFIGEDEKLHLDVLKRRAEKDTIYIKKTGQKIEADDETEDEVDEIIIYTFDDKPTALTRNQLNAINDHMMKGPILFQNETVTYNIEKAKIERVKPNDSYDTVRYKRQATAINGIAKICCEALPDTFKATMNTTLSQEALDKFLTKNEDYKLKSIALKNWKSEEASRITASKESFFTPPPKTEQPQTKQKPQTTRKPK